MNYTEIIRFNSAIDRMNFVDWLQEHRKVIQQHVHNGIFTSRWDLALSLMLYQVDLTKGLNIDFVTRAIEVIIYDFKRNSP